MPYFGIQTPKRHTFFLYSSFIFFSLVNQIQAQEHPSRKEVLTAVNSYIDFISNYAYKTRFLHRSHYYYYNNLVRSYKKQINIPSFLFSPSKNPSKDVIAYQIARANSVYIPSEFRTQINLLADSLRNIQQEQLRIAENLKKLTYNPNKDSISYRKGFSWMKDLYNHAESYRNLSHKFYVLSKEIDSKYKITDSKWIEAGALMEEAIDTSRSYLHMVQESLKNKTPVPNTEPLETLLDQMKKERNSVLNGLKEYGSYNGKDPHSKYDSLITDLSLFIEKLNSDYDINNTRNNLFNELLYHVNWAIVRYNNFAILSGENDQNTPPAYLLKQPIETLFYVYKPIEESNTKTIPNRITPETSMKGYAPNHLVFLLDVSGSMNHSTKLPLFKDAIKQIAPIMRSQDKFSVVVYSDDAKVAFSNVSFTNTEAIHTLLSLESKGKTNAYKGIQKAYTLAQNEFIVNGNNRIIMITDGDFDTSNKVFNLIVSNDQKDIRLSILTFGFRIHHIQEMKRMTLLGGGNYTQVKKDNHIKTILKEIQIIKPKPQPKPVNR